MCFIAEVVPICPTKSAGLATAAPCAPESSMECPVCLQPCIHPARLPCGHVFCFLCLKGIAQQSRRCAMCRQEIAPDYLDKPDLLDTPNPQVDKEETFEDGYQWFYEGRNGKLETWLDNPHWKLVGNLHTVKHIPSKCQLGKKFSQSLNNLDMY